MAAVYVRGGHDDDTPVAQIFDVEIFADARAERTDQRLDFVVIQHLVEAGAFSVQNLTAQRENRLEMAVTPLLGRTTCRVTLDDEDFRAFAVFGAVRQFAGKGGAFEQAWTTPHQIAGFTRRFTRTHTDHALLDNAPRVTWVQLKELVEGFGHNLRNRTLHFGIDQFHLRLAFK